MLRELCDQNDRLDCQTISRRRTMSHGAVLNELCSQEQSAIFAFMDSDSFATGDWFQQLAPYLRDQDAVFAGSSVWNQDGPHTLARGSQWLSDAFDRMYDDSCFGSSCFALYDMRVLSDCMRDTGSCFNECFWHEIPPTAQQELAGGGKKMVFYDTGKLLNIIVGLRGHMCKNVHLPHLWHVGGMSSLVISRRRLAHLVDIIGILQPLRRFLRCSRLSDDPMRGIAAEERERYHQFNRRRESVSHHLGVLLRCLQDGQPFPLTFQHQNEALVATVTRAEEHIRMLHVVWLTSNGGDRYN